MIEVVANDRLGKKVRVKCNEDDLVGDLKKLIAAQIGTRPEKIRIQKWYTVYKVRGVERASAKRVSWHTVSTCWTAHAAGQQRLPRSPPFTAKCRLLLQDHITLSDYEIHDGMGLELYYN